MSPLRRPQGYELVTADTTDVFANHSGLQGAGPGVYRLWIVAAAAADGTFTINDGRGDIVTSESIPLRAAAVTYPEVRLDGDPFWEWFSHSDHPDVDVVDGTNAEVVCFVMKVAE